MKKRDDTTTDKENNFCEKQKACCICKKWSSTDKSDKNVSKAKKAEKPKIIVITLKNLEELFMLFVI